MDHIDFFLLFLDGLGKGLSLLFILDHIFLMLLDTFLILIDCKAVFILEEMNLLKQIVHLFF